MNVNPEINIVVFEVKRFLKKERFAENAPTRNEDCIRSAWRALQSKTGARASQVRHVYSEWEPADTDKRFMAETFPRAEFSYSFARPAEDGWEKAFQDAAQTMLDTQAEDLSAELKERRATGKSRLFPVLRTITPGDPFTETVVHLPLGADLAIFLAYVGPTPQNKIGIDYVMRNSVEPSPEALVSLFETAWQNFASDLNIRGGEDDGEKMVVVSHPMNMASSALGLPNFYEQACSWLGQDEVFAAITDPANLYLTLPESQTAVELRQAVEQSDYRGAVALTPACYYLNDSGIRQVAARTPRT